MTKIFFPFNDQPKRFPFKLSQPIRFPFIVNDIVYYWDIGALGITLYLQNEMVIDSAPTLKDVVLEDTGIVVYLRSNDLNAGLNTGQQINISFEQIGAGMHTLGILDTFKLGNIDHWTLGEISARCADWLILKDNPLSVVRKIDSQANNVQMQIDSDSVLPCAKDVYIEIDENINILGLSKQRFLTIGDLDPKILCDIDAMLSTFNILEKIPAKLTKYVYIAHNSMLENSALTTSFNGNIDADNIVVTIHNNETESEKAVFVTVAGNIGLSNESISLVIT